MEHLQHKPLWGRTLFWGGVTALLYTLLFSYSDLILHLAHTTPASCVVAGENGNVYYHKAQAAACAAMNGHFEPANPLHVLAPILIALALSLAHGAFTGLFWDVMGLKAATGADAGRK